MVASTEAPAPIAVRREVDALVFEDGWTACGGCTQKFGYKIEASEEGSRVKCPNSRCGVWVRIPPRLRDRVSRRL